MTTTAQGWKACEHCGTVYHRRANVSAPGWTARRFCTAHCSNLHRQAAGTLGHNHQPPQPHMPAPARKDWMADAFCRKSKTDEFVPDHRRDADRALWWCGHCPVTTECLAYALATSSCGVWGGRWLPPGNARRNLARYGASAPGAAT